MAEKHKGTTTSGDDVCHCYQGGGFHPRSSCGPNCECCDPGGNRAVEDMIRRPVTNGEDSYRGDSVPHSHLEGFAGSEWSNYTYTQAEGDSVCARAFGPGHTMTDFDCIPDSNGTTFTCEVECSNGMTIPVNQNQSLSPIEELTSEGSPGNNYSRDEEVYRRDMLGADGVTTTIIDDGYRVDPSKKKFEPYIIGGLVAVGVLFLFGFVKFGGAKENK